MRYLSNLWGHLSCSQGYMALSLDLDLALTLFVLVMGPEMGTYTEREDPDVGMGFADNKFRSGTGKVPR